MRIVVVAPLFPLLGDVCAQNLVPNSGFELLDTCPYTVGFQLGDRPLDWFSWFNSPDYFNACAGDLGDIDTLVDVPRNGWTFQHAWDGQAYVGVYAYDGYAGDYREYVGAELIEPLKVGCAYGLRFRANPAANGTYWLEGDGGVSNNLGMLFTMSSNAWTAPSAWPPGPDFGPRNYAHLFAPAPIVDTAAWTLIEGTFTADSAYGYVVLGNFFTDALTIGYPTSGSSIDLSYYLLDGVEVFPLDAECHTLHVTDAAQGDPPAVAVDATMVHFTWPDRWFALDLWDVVGRRSRSTPLAGRDKISIVRPSQSGCYIARLSHERSTFVLRFIVE